jgi:hypothetical protein
MMMNKGIFSRWQETGLRLARWLVIGFAIFQICLSLTSIILTPSFIQKNYAEFTPNNSWTPELTQTALQLLHWNPQTVAWVGFGKNALNFIICYLLAFIVLRRKSQDWFGLYLALAFFMLGGFAGKAIDPYISQIPVLAYLIHNVLGAVSWQFFAIIFFLFPDGKPVPSWTRWIIITWLGLMLLSSFSTDRYSLFSQIHYVLASVFFFISISCQVYRQLKRASAIQKQQTKWVVFSLALSVAVMLPFGILSLAYPPAADTLTGDLVMAIVFQVLVLFQGLLIASSIMISILKHRLYDVDRLLSRTLVYSLLTGLLGLVYFGSVALLQGIVPTNRGQPSPVIIVVTTLAIATIFNPLRVRLQNIIDRRFYRQKYDAEKALAEFAAATRSETDLNQLSLRMNNTVSETLQPEKVITWLATNTVSITPSVDNSR